MTRTHKHEGPGRSVRVIGWGDCLRCAGTKTAEAEMKEMFERCASIACGSLSIVFVRGTNLKRYISTMALRITYSMLGLLACSLACCHPLPLFHASHHAHIHSKSMSLQGGQLLVKSWDVPCTTMTPFAESGKLTWKPDAFCILQPRLVHWSTRILASNILPS